MDECKPLPSEVIHASRSPTVSFHRSRSKKSLAPPPTLTYHPAGGVGPGYRGLHSSTFRLNVTYLFLGYTGWRQPVIVIVKAGSG